MSSENISEVCAHCDTKSGAFGFVLQNSQEFFVVADANPIVEGHILIIPKLHISCVGEYSEDLFGRFKKIYERVYKFVANTYGSCATFEHGIVGQTVFHSHIHLMPASEIRILDIVPEGQDFLTEVSGWEAARDAYKKEGKYLFFSLEKNKYVVSTTLATPRFFRDRFAKALGVPERGNWRTLASTPELLEQSKSINEHTMAKWSQFYIRLVP